MTQYEYDQVDRLTERTLPNGVVTTYSYDDRDRVTSVVHLGRSEEPDEADWLLLRNRTP